MKNGGVRARDGVRAKPGATRCPFCHEDCDPDGQVTVCRECLVRHHTECWGEGHGCANCGSTKGLAQTGVSSPEPAAPREELTAALTAAAQDWSRMLLAYNAVLGAVTVLGTVTVVFLTQVPLPRFAPGIVLGAVVANVCFLLGPVIDVVALAGLGYRGQALRWFLFLAGTALAVLLALGVILSLGFMHHDF